MISKNEMVMDYIAGLEAGEKVSVRSLAEVLGVSEGTAYKGIKQAEAQGLVITKPKVGTVRINLRGSEIDDQSSLAEAARSIGAVCLCGSERAAEIELPYIVVADGNEKQFRETVHRVGGRALCIFGGRPELQDCALELGCHILLSGGSTMEAQMLKKAESRKLCVFVSEQDSSTLLGMLHRRMHNEAPAREMSHVRDWMQMPRYLYHDDMISEWYRLYSDLYYRGTSCAVVDDRLRICGSIDAASAMRAASMQAVSDFMDEPEDGSYVSENMSMDELAELFVKSGRMFAAVNSSDGMSGFISLSDVIRYYIHSTSYRFFGSEGGKLEIASEDGENERRLYTFQMDDATAEINRSAYISSIYSAAAWHAHYVLAGPVELESGSVNTLETPMKAGEYLISSNLLKKSGDELLLELEMYNDRASYAKASLRYKLSKNDTN